MELLSDTTAVVTGGASGIGRQICLKFAEHGADVVVADIREDPREGGAPTHEKINDETDSQAGFVECDVRSIEDLETAVLAADEFGGIDVMVNNAGIGDPGNFMEVTPGELDENLAINIKGFYFGSQVAAKHIDEGSIINMSSIAGLRGHHKGVTYAMAKGAVKILTNSLAATLGPDIRVNSIHPGAIETELSKGVTITEENREETIEGIPRGRIGTPEDVAGAAVFLASDLADYVTSHALLVDGGKLNSA